MWPIDLLADNMDIAGASGLDIALCSVMLEDINAASLKLLYDLALLLFPILVSLSRMLQKAGPIEW